MAILLTLLGWLLLILLAALVALLVLPWRFDAEGRFLPCDVGVSAGLDWAGLASLRFDVPSGLQVRLAGWSVYRGWPGGDGGQQPQEERGWRPAIGSWRPGWRMALRLGARVFRALHLRAGVGGRLGAGNPADTARIWLAVAAARRVVPALEVQELQIDWLEPACDLRAWLCGRVVPVHVGWVVAAELWRARRKERR